MAARFILTGGAGGDGTVGNEFPTWAAAKAYGSWADGDTLEVETGVVWRETVDLDSSWSGYDKAVSIKSDTPGTQFIVTPSVAIPATVGAGGDWDAGSPDGNGEYILSGVTNNNIMFIENGVRISGRYVWTGTDSGNWYPQVGALNPGEFAIDTATNKLYFKPTAGLVECELTQGAKAGIAFEDCTGAIEVIDCLGYGAAGSRGGVWLDNCQNITLTRCKGQASYYGVMANRLCDDIVYTNVDCEDIYWHGIGQVGPNPGVDTTIRTFTMNNLLANGVGNKQYDGGDGSGIITQPFKTITGSDWRVFNCGYEGHTKADKDYLVASDMVAGLLNGYGISIDSSHCTLNNLFAKNCGGNGIHFSGGQYIGGVYTASMAANNLIAVNCGLNAGAISASHNPVGIFNIDDSTTAVTINGLTVEGGKSGEYFSINSGAVELYCNTDVTGSTLNVEINRMVIDGVVGDFALTIKEEAGSTVNYTGNNNMFNAGGATPYAIRRNGGADNTYDLAGWKTATSQDAASTEDDPEFIAGITARGQEPADVYPTTYSPAYHAGSAISAANDYEGNAFNASAPTLGAIEFKSGTVKSTATGIYLPSFDTIAVWIA